MEINMAFKVCVEVDPDNGGGEPTPGVRSFTQTVGDGTSTSFTVNHNLGTADVVYSVRNLATGEVDTYDVTATATASGLALAFATPPALNGARVTVLAV